MGRRVRAEFPLTLTDFGIAPPAYLGVGVGRTGAREGCSSTRPARPRHRQSERVAAVALAALSFLSAAGPAAAEPIFLSRQYARCTGCHFSPTGGGLLTPIRAVSVARGALHVRQEQRFGDAGPRARVPVRRRSVDALGPVSVGADLWPAHLDVDAAGFQSTRNFLMNADVTVAFRHENWTAYGELGASRAVTKARIASFEHWLGYQATHLGAPRRPFPARIRRPVRRPHVVHASDAGPRHR